VTPEGSHLEAVLKAVSAGKHVFVEKPLATNLNHCSRMIEAARKARRILMVGISFVSNGSSPLFFSLRGRFERGNGFLRVQNVVMYILH